LLLRAKKRRLNEEKGAVALATLAFLASFFSVSLAVLWGFSQFMATSSYLQSTAQTAAYAAVNRVDPNAGAVTIDCLDDNGEAKNVYSNNYLCTKGKALETAQRVFAASLRGQPFALCDNTDGNGSCTGSNPVTLIARSDDATEAPSIKVFPINTRKTKECDLLPDKGDRDLGRINPRPVTEEPDPPPTDEEIACWVLEDSRYVAGSKRWVRIAGLNNVTPGVIIRAQAEVKPPIIGLFTTVKIEVSAVALRGGAAPPPTPGGY
jgi:Flp pilus assembly protein TadG